MVDCWAAYALCEAGWTTLGELAQLNVMDIEHAYHALDASQSAAYRQHKRQEEERKR